MPFKAFGFAGIKDKVAVTCQAVTVTSHMLVGANSTWQSIYGLHAKSWELSFLKHDTKFGLWTHSMLASPFARHSGQEKPQPMPTDVIR